MNEEEFREVAMSHIDNAIEFLGLGDEDEGTTTEFEVETAGIGGYKVTITKLHR